MTAPNGPILLNNSTGSATEASGLGPATAVFGSGASTTAASAVVTGIDTTGVSAGDLLWVVSSSGRQFSIIASVDSGTQVTCDNTFANTEGSRNWAIGGKRQTLDNASSRRLFEDGASGLEFQIEYTGSDYTLTSAMQVLSGSTPTYTITGTGGLPVLRQTANAAVWGQSNQFFTLNFRNLGFQNSNGTKTSAHGVTSDFKATYNFFDCVVGDATNQLNIGISLSPGTRIVNTTVHHCTGAGIDGFQGYIFNSRIVDNGGDGINTAAGNVSLIIIGNVIAGNGGEGIDAVMGTGSPTMLISGNTIAGNGSHGISMDRSTSFMFFNNVITANGGYGLNRTSGGASSTHIIVGGNCFGSGSDTWGGANTSGEANGYTLDSTDVVADPQFVDAASGDFTPSNASLEGVSLEVAA